MRMAVLRMCVLLSFMAHTSQTIADVLPIGEQIGYKGFYCMRVGAVRLVASTFGVGNFDRGMEILRADPSCGEYELVIIPRMKVREFVFEGKEQKIRLIAADVNAVGKTYKIYLFTTDDALAGQPI